MKSLHVICGLAPPNKKFWLRLCSIYGHESWVMTERVQLQVQPSEMRFFRRIDEVALFSKVRSSEIQKSLNIESLLLQIERSQLRWFGHVSRMPQKLLPKQAYWPKPMGED